jgi:hypothetical protein
MSKIFITLLAISCIIEHLLSKLKDAAMWLFVNLSWLILNSCLTIWYVLVKIYSTAHNLIVRVIYYFLLLILFFLDIISLPFVFIIYAYAIKKYSESKGVNYYQGLLLAREDRLEGYLNPNKLVYLCYIIAILLLLIIFQLFN